MKSLKNIRHVIIIYPIFEEEKAEFISTFFRLTGIYVLTFVDEFIDDKTDLSCEDFVIVLNDSKDKLIRDRYWDDNWIEFCMDFFPGKEAGSAQGSEILLECLCRLLDRMQETDSKGRYSEEVFSEMKELAAVYIGQNLLLHNYHLRLVTITSEKKDKTLLKVIEHFLEAVSEVEKLKESRHSFYFKQECKRKVNLGCRLVGRLKYYRPDDLLKDNVYYLRKNEDFTCLWTLTGLIADEDNDKLYQAVNYYQMHLDEEKRLGYVEDQKFHGYIYYRIGRYCEKIEENWERALRYYNLAYRSAPLNYRFVYKVAFAYEILDDDLSAEKYYNLIMKQMEPYIKENYLSPCKSEYAFKVTRRLMLLNKRHEQYFYAKIMAELAIQIWKNVPENKFIDKFYNDLDAEEIKKGLQQRLGIQKTKEELEDIDKIIEMYF